MWVRVVVCVYIYIRIYMCVCMCVCVCLFVFVCERVDVRLCVLVRALLLSCACFV